MYRNRLEILSLLLIVKSLAKYFYTEFFNWLSSWLNKYNYVEYIKRVKVNLINGFNPLVCEVLKVLYGVFLLRVLASAKKC